MPNVIVGSPTLLEAGPDCLRPGVRLQSPSVKHPPLYPTYPIATLRELLEQAVARYGSKAALVSKRQGKYQPTNYQELGVQVRQLATFFDHLGTAPGDRIAVLGENRTEWAIAYLAVVSSGRVVVPIDKDLTPREIRHIIDYSGARLLCCSGDSLSYFEGDIAGAVEKKISFEDEAGQADFGFPAALKQGAKLLKKGNQAFEEAVVNSDSLAAIIFTSGTMGSSKGVMLTHGNLSANIISTSQMVSISNNDIVLSVLPLHHTYECTCGFLTALYQGATIYHAENLRRIAENLQEARATVMLGVPVLFEAIYRRIEKGIQEKGERKFKFARGLASFVQRVSGLDLRRRLFGSLHKRFGGRLRLLISGGAAINPEVSKGFRELGITFIQGYGMTEASPLIAVNREGCLKDDSAGIPIPGVEIKFVNGEIVVRGANVMKGYYLNPAATDEALRDGWLNTGDLGHLDDDGFLFISGRKKSLIVTPNGKNVYPEEVENVLNESPFILESLVWGGPETDPAKVEVQAIIVYDSEAFDQQFGASQYDRAAVNAVISEEMKKANRKLANYKRVKKFVLRDSEFEKTTTRKIKRYLYTGTPKSLEPHP